MPHILDGKELSALMKEQIKKQTAEWVSQGGKKPHLAAILVGTDGASETYVASKIKDCEEVGFDSTLVRFNSDVSEEELLQAVREINNNPDIDGLIVQSPLPKHISDEKVIETILPSKDVDGFHPENAGRLALGMPTYVSATPAGIMFLLEHFKVETAGKNCVVLGRSHIVGTPVSLLMSRNTYPGNATVTICHSKTKNLAEITKQADIIIAAIGKPEFLTADMVKDGAVVVDVGITRIPDTTKKAGFRLAGDVKYSEVAPKCSFITPVPGGVGPMTRTALLFNTLKAAKKEVYI